MTGHDSICPECREVWDSADHHRCPSCKPRTINIDSVLQDIDFKLNKMVKSKLTPQQQLKKRMVQHPWRYTECKCGHINTKSAIVDNRCGGCGEHLE